MSDIRKATTTAGWLKEFAEEAERDLGWHHEFEVKQVGAWEKPGSKETLLYFAINWPMSIRHKRNRITISGPFGAYSYPEPMRAPLWKGTNYHYPVHGFDGMTDWTVWADDDSDHDRLRRGRVHLDEESAREHAEAEVRAAGFEL